MSTSLAWVAVQGLSPEDFLDRAGFEETGEFDEYFGAEHSGGELENGWYVLVTGDVDLIAPARLAQWSVGARLVALVAHEEASTSLAMEWTNGVQVWSVFHDGEDETKNAVAVDGALPDSFHVIRDEALALAAESRGEDLGLAYSIALDLAEEITGFRHDALGFDEDIPVFNVLERIHAAG